MRKIVINEDTEQKIIGRLMTECFTPNVHQVLLVKDYLDKNFQKQYIDDIDENGEPKTDLIFYMLSPTDKSPMKQYTAAQLLDKLDSNFSKFMKDKKDRKRLLKQIITDWATNKISREGLLSVNNIK